MKIFQIIDKETGAVPGTLLYAEKDKVFIVELAETLDEWSTPLLFSGFVKRGIYTVPRDISLAWVRERIIPSGRQNISDIFGESEDERIRRAAFFGGFGGSLLSGQSLHKKGQRASRICCAKAASQPDGDVSGFQEQLDLLFLRRRSKKGQFGEAARFGRHQ